jgi:eukaryotic-like serine/threonine-protein kinase
MPLATKDHPNADALKAYGQGRLPAGEMSAIEVHLADCGSCCEALAQLPDDTLLLRAREAATSGFRAREHTVAIPQANPREIPPPLKDHPRYRVLGLLGVGGMGAVYKAEHRKMERLVALKVINPALVSSPAALERFEREVKTAAKLLHPNIVTAHDAEQAGDLHFLVMEFVEGVSLDRQVAKSGPLAPQLAAHLIRQAAIGLQHAHEKGMIHRDIKPQNLMVSRGSDGPVLKILDFGLARFASQALQSAANAPESAARPDNATRAGAVLGTPDYIAPEQATDAHTADIRADIYSLGCTLYFLLTGEPPFAGGSMLDKLHAHKTCEPTPIRLRRPEVSEGLAAVLERMLAKNPADRYATPGELAQALKPFANSRSAATTGEAQSVKGSVSGGVPTPTIASEPIAEAPPQISPRDFAIPSAPTFNEPAIENRPTRGANRKSHLSPLIWIGSLAAAIALVAMIWSFNQGNQKLAPSKKSPPSVAQSPVPSPTANRTVLMVLPLNYTYFPDYENVRKGLQGTSIKLETAALSNSAGVGFASIAGAAPPGGSPLVPDKELSQVTADNYAGIIFIGAQAGELCGQEKGAPLIKKLLSDFKRQGKPITALCAGQHVLAEHGLLTADRKVAGGPNATQVPGFLEKCKAQKQGWGVVKDGQLITGSGAADGAEFASVLFDAILKSK